MHALHASVKNDRKFDIKSAENDARNVTPHHGYNMRLYVHAAPPSGLMSSSRSSTPVLKSASCWSTSSPDTAMTSLSFRVPRSKGFFSVEISYVLETVGQCRRITDLWHWFTADRLSLLCSRVTIELGLPRPNDRWYSENFMSSMISSIITVSFVLDRSLIWLILYARIREHEKLQSRVSRSAYWLVL